MKNETKLHKECIKTLKSNNIPFVDTLQVSTVSGTADIILCLNGVYTEIELKTEIGSLSEAQIERARQVQAFGGKFFLVRNYLEFEEVLKGNKREYKPPISKIFRPF